MLSQRVRTIEPSATLAVNSLRLKLQGEGRTIYNFGAGEPDFDTPGFIVEAAIEALHAGWTRYTPVPGVLELRAAVAEEMKRTRNLDVAPEQVIITSGAKQACAEFFQSRLDPGDEVLLPAPYWVSYPDMIRLTDGIPVVVPTLREQGYRVTAEQLEAYVTPRTVGLLINTPNNPTGAIYSATELAQLVDFAESHDLWILSDEIYERFVYEGEFASPARGAGESRTTIVGGASKAFAMTGWRIGWAVGDRETIGGMTRLQGHTASNATAVSQAAALAALRADPSFLDEPLRHYATRRGQAIEALSSIPGLEFHVPEGAFYIFLDLKELLGKDGRPEAAGPFCEKLLAEAGVALVPGEAFGDATGARLSYSCSAEELEAGIHALDAFIRGSER